MADPKVREYTTRQDIRENRLRRQTLRIVVFVDDIGYFICVVPPASPVRGRGVRIPPRVGVDAVSRYPSLQMDVSPSRTFTTPDAGAVIAARFREELRSQRLPGHLRQHRRGYLIEGRCATSVRTSSPWGGPVALENRLTLVGPGDRDRRWKSSLERSGAERDRFLLFGHGRAVTPRGQKNRRAAFEEVPGEWRAPVPDPPRGSCEPPIPPEFPGVALRDPAPPSSCT